MLEFEEFQKIVAEVLGVSPKSVSRRSTFLDDLGADSLQMFEIMTRACELFQTEADEGEFLTASTVDEAFHCLTESKL